MCFIISYDLYTALHNSLGICHQLKIHLLYGTFNFLTQCICMGTDSLFDYGFRLFRGKARPLQRKCAFAVASIVARANVVHSFKYLLIHWVNKQNLQLIERVEGIFGCIFTNWNTLERYIYDNLQFGKYKKWNTYQFWHFLPLLFYTLLNRSRLFLSNKQF